MEIGKRVDFRKVVIFGYVFLFAIYLIIGLTPAEAAHYDVDGSLSIPSIGLNSDVVKLKLDNYRLPVPDNDVGSFSRYENKTLLIGHSSTVFEYLKEVEIGDYVVYNGNIYTVDDKVVLEKSQVKMNEILSDTEEKTIVIMTCAGENLANRDATHRLLVSAKIISFASE